MCFKQVLKEGELVPGGLLKTDQVWMGILDNLSTEVLSVIPGGNIRALFEIDQYIESQNTDLVWRPFGRALFRS